jgi:hypothetical protein
MGTHSAPIKLGTKVIFDLIDRRGHKERLSVVIVADESADFEHGYLSESTPLGKVLLGEQEGNVIPYLKDDIMAIEILQVAKTTELPSQDAAEKRKTRMRKAIREVENTNAMVFASSFSGKWGDYDPDSIPKENLPQDSDQDKQ